MSNEHKKYLKKIKREKLIVITFQILILVGFLILWELLSKYKIINPFIFSSPSKLIETIKNLYFNYNLVEHILTTLYETLIAFILGITLSFIIAIILYEFKILNKIVDPYLTMLNSLPKVSLGPIIIILAGASAKSIIIMALFISIIITIINVKQAFNNVDENKIRLLKSFKAKHHQIFFKLILPSNYNNLVNVCKVNIGLIFIGVIMGEFLVSKAGVGYLIMYGSQVFNLNLVMTGIILLSVMATLLYYLIVFIEKRLQK